MTTFLVSLSIGVLAGIICFFIEKIDKIPIHIDHHHDPVLAALNGGVAAFFAALIMLTTTNFLI
jgi:hypothetical protein